MFMVICAVDRIWVISVMVPSIELVKPSLKRELFDFNRVISSDFSVAIMFFLANLGDAAA